MHEDLDAVIIGRGSGPTQQIEMAPAMKSSAEAETDVETDIETGIDEWQVMGLRRKIAEHMQASKSSIPHITYVEEMDVTELEKLRQHMNETGGEGQPKLTILPFLMRAMAVASRVVPKISAHYNDEKNVVTQFKAMHIGVATQTDGGLMVPVVRHAEARSLRSLAAEIRRLADAARNGSITRDQLSRFNHHHIQSCVRLAVSSPHR